ncbi:MAG: TonB-dependent receptor plug domain-containing protein, partial [Pseudomonadales bacterium]
LPVAAQESDYELVTTGMHTIRSETALPLTVLAGDTLRSAARATIGETLANQPGINNASFGPAVGQTVIRGQQGRRVMNLNNSIANADASGNSADHSVAVEAILANAIEVLRGPSTLLYGGGAIGGVINVIDNRIPRNLPDSPLFILETRHDTAADQTNSIGRLEFATGNLAWHLDGLRRDWNNLDIPDLAIAPDYLDDDEENTTGYIRNTAGKSEAATVGVSWLFDNGFLGVAINQMENFYGLPPGAHGHEEDQHGHEEDQTEDSDESVFIDMDRTRYDLTGEWRNLTPWLEHVDYRLTMSEYQHVELEGVEFGTRFSNDAWQQRLQLTHTEIGNWHGVIGLQSSDEEFGAVGEESFIPVTDITSRGLFLVEDYHGTNYTLELGARINSDDYNPVNGIAPDRDFSTFSASASLLLDLASSTTLG